MFESFTGFREREKMDLAFKISGFFSLVAISQKKIIQFFICHGLSVQRARRTMSSMPEAALNILEVGAWRVEVPYI